ncbi:unnamed protein product [Cuscuta epithymum]|uniref:Myb/SANT-like domain-containing protein n=1 Tax=Cuscuta epithymum TaxID=186058 RepID=A0AAV0E1I5_9ASTE|nr:unnamed protein product [Cuscuta epithymum]
MAPERKKSVGDTQRGESESSVENKGGRIVWSKNSLHILCDLCIKYVEKSKGKNGGVTSQRLLWKKIESEFERETKLPWDKTKLKNKVDWMRNRWTLWKQLKAKDTGLGWDHVTGTIDASSDWWALKIKENSKFESFQDEGIEPEVEYKMDQIFSCSAQGNLKYTPGNITSQEDVQPDMDDVYIPSPPRPAYHDTTNIEDTHNVGGSSTGNASWDDLWSEFSPTRTPPTTLNRQNTQVHNDEIRIGKRPIEVESSQSNKSARPTHTKKGGMATFQEMCSGMMEVVSKRSESFNEVTGLMKDMIKANSNTHTSQYGIGETMAKLICLDGLSTISPEFFFACTMFEDPQCRTIFFSLPDDNSRVEYIRFMYKKSGN